MKLPELLRLYPPSADLAGYRRTPRHMPPLDATKLSMTALVGDQTRGRLIEGGAALLLSYKAYDAATTSFDEHDDGERWDVLQLQGMRSRKAMRVASCFAVAQCFAEQLRRYMFHPEAEVRRVTMPHPYGVTNLDGARDFEGAVRKYEVYASLLGLEYSGEEHMYILDVRKAINDTITG